MPGASARWRAPAAARGAGGQILFWIKVGVAHDERRAYQTLLSHSPNSLYKVRTMSTRLLPAALGSLLVLLVAGVASAQDQEKGRALAVNLCAHCHMNEGQGEKQTPMGGAGLSRHCQSA